MPSAGWDGKWDSVRIPPMKMTDSAIDFYINQAHDYFYKHGKF